MKKTLVGGLTAILMTSGVGLTAATAQASPSPTTATRAALGLPLQLPLNLNLCTTLLTRLCADGTVGPLLLDVDGALTRVAATPSDPTAVTELVDAILDTLTGATGATAEDQSELLNAIAALLANPELSSVVDQITDALRDSTAGTPVSNVLETTEELVSGLLGLGDETVDPALVQGLVQQILSALATDDTAGLNTLLTTLLRSLPGGSALDNGVLTGLLGDITGTLANAATGVDPTPTVDRVDDALNPPVAAASATPSILAVKKFVTTKTPRIRGGGTPGATVTVRTSKGAVLGTATVSSSGSFAVVSSKLARGAYTVTATQVSPGMSASASSAARKFRVVSATPAVTTKTKQRFSTHRPKITGIGYPKSTIVLRSTSGKKLGTARVHTNGKWTIKSKQLSSGTKKVKAIQTGHGKKKTSKAKTIRIR